MTRSNAQISIVLVALFGLSACNLPVAPASSKAPSGATTAMVSAASECRSGPGDAFPGVAALKPGQVLNVVARNPDSSYLLVQDPADPSGECWAPMSSAIVSGSP